MEDRVGNLEADDGRGGAAVSSRSGRAVRSFIILLTVAAAAGCASVPAFHVHEDLRSRKPGIRTVGVLAPVIGMFRELPRIGLNRTEPHDEWSPAAVEAVARALSDELSGQGLKVKAVPADDPDLREAAELFTAVDFSIQRHSWDIPQQTMPPSEPFPEKVRTLDYSLGPLQEAMDRHQIDAVWMVRGFNLLPTTGASLKEGAEFMISMLAAMGGVVAPTQTLKKVELRLALVDRTGSVLFYGIADEVRAGRPAAERSGTSQRMKGELDPVRPEDGPVDLTNDLRDPRVARHYIKAALKSYREGTVR